MASNSWSDLKSAIQDWKDTRLDKARKRVEEDAAKLKEDIVNRINGSKENKTPGASDIGAMTNVSAEAKAQHLAPKGNKEEKSHLSGLALYANSIIVDDESSGPNYVHVVKIEDVRKKDETSGMPLAKIAKAAEFGTRRSKPNPAWRRSLKKLEQTGVYKKTT